MPTISSITSLGNLRHANRLKVCLKSLNSLTVAGISILLLTSCHHNRLPDCVVGQPAPSSALLARWDSSPNASTLDLAIDGSGSMAGLTGSAEASSLWKALLRGVNLAAPSQGLEINAERVGSGVGYQVNTPLDATNSCFFRGCNGYKELTSTLHSVWDKPGLTAEQIPLRMVISDLEVNNGNIAKLVASIRPHVEAGATISIIALKLPFNGNVFNSDANVIHRGEANRPIYLLATGPRKQLHKLMVAITKKAANEGVPPDSIKLTNLDDHVSRPTMTAKRLVGLPASVAKTSVPIYLAGLKYNKKSNPHYQFAELNSSDSSEFIISSSADVSHQGWQSNTQLIDLENISLPGFDGANNRTKIGGFALNGADLKIKFDASTGASQQLLRAVIPRGQLPEAWWISWNRPFAVSEAPQNQTQGLLQLMTTLGELLVEPNTSPAAAFCFATNQT